MNKNMIYLNIKKNKSLEDAIIKAVNSISELMKESYQLMFIEPPKVMKDNQELLDIHSKITICKRKNKWIIKENKLYYEGKLIKLANLQLLDECKAMIY